MATAVVMSAQSKELTCSSSISDSNRSFDQDITVGRFGSLSQRALSVPPDTAVANMRFPYTTVEGIWKKAVGLVSEDGAIVPAPGLGHKDRMVKSKSGSAPHLVKVSGSQYYCDDKCPHFKSLSFCSQVVAAAESNNDLADFLKWFQSKCRNSLNLMKMSKHGMPAGAGRKGGKIPKKKSTSTHVPTDENRVPLSATQSAANTGNSSGVINFAPVSSVTGVYNMCSPSYSFGSPISPSYDSPFGSPFGSPFALCQPSSHNFMPWMWPSSPYSTWPGSNQLFGSTSHELSQEPYAVEEKFKVCFKAGNISVCSGCRNNFNKSDVIVLQHAEHRQYNNPHTGLPATKYGNAYYHVRKMCVQLKWGSRFHPKSVVVEEEIKQKLTPKQKDEIAQEFNAVV